MYFIFIQKQVKYEKVEKVATNLQENTLKVATNLQENSDALQEYKIKKSKK